MAFDWGLNIVRGMGCFWQLVLVIAGLGMVALSFSWYLEGNTLNAIYWLMLSAFAFRWAADHVKNMDEREKETEAAEKSGKSN